MQRQIGFAIGVFFSVWLIAADQAVAYTLKTLHRFCSSANCTDGMSTTAGLAMDSRGNLYGTTRLGGAYGQGVVFQLTPNADGWTYSVLYNFCAKPNCLDGAQPYASLIVDIRGNLYGTATSGGANNQGTVFRLGPGANTRWALTTLYSFCADANCADGAFPFAGVTYANAAKGLPSAPASPLFGTTVSGGSTSGGVAYELTRNHGAWEETLLYTFCTIGGESCLDGAGPKADMIFDNSGNMFGIAGGTAYELSPNGSQWLETPLYRFCKAGGCQDGVAPLGPILLDRDGRLWGVTEYGGQWDYGVAYEIVPAGEYSQEYVVHDFCGYEECYDGSRPFGGLTGDAPSLMFGTTMTGGLTDYCFGGCGLVFSLSGTQYTWLYQFCAELSCPDGAMPASPVLVDGRGDLFGTTLSGDRKSV